MTMWRCFIAAGRRKGRDAARLERELEGTDVLRERIDKLEAEMRDADQIFPVGVRSVKITLRQCDNS